MRVDEQAGLLGSTSFSQDDQEWFAAVSRDFNPMHMDAVTARRLLSGRPVVHGIHTLLLALELWQRQSPSAVASVECEFGNPVNVGDEAQFRLLDEQAGRFSLVATVDGLSCTRVTIETEASRPKPETRPDSASTDAHHVGVLDAPLDEAPTAHPGRHYVLPLLSSEAVAQHFPHIATALTPARLAAIASLSRFVGMVCPGLHSVFSWLRFTPGDEAEAGQALRYTVQKYDDRFRLFSVDFDGCIRGQLRAFLRPPPQSQPTMEMVAARVMPGEFSASRSLVIGGSRGLGETVAKILGAGGGNVIVSHAAGADDAQRVADEINRGEGWRCSTLKLDLRSDAFDSLPVDVATLDAVYFFATPRIFKKKAGLFERRLFDEFVAFYIDRFAELCAWLENGAGERGISVYLPSTVFITERPKGLTEYAMAKAAAEVLAEDLNRSLKQVRIIVSRLPRLATDQTASVMKLSTASNLEVMLPVVRQVSGR